MIYTDDGPHRVAVEAYQIHRRSPDLVLVDTQVIAESPPRFLAAGIGDAMSTFYEARAVASAGRPNMRGGRSTLAALDLEYPPVTEEQKVSLEQARVALAGE